MRAIRNFGPHDLRVVELDEPETPAGYVKIAVRASGICGSDKHWWHSGPTDFIAGHEAAGEVTELGDGVKRLEVGDRVAINNVVGCGVCAECRAGRFVRCASRPGKDVGNGFAEILVAPERNCMVIHPSLDYVAGCLVFDNWGTPYAALLRAAAREGDDVLVSGCGPIGLCAVALAKYMGAYVLAVDPAEYRRRAALRAGADLAAGPADAVESAKRLSDGAGVSLVLECSGVGAAYRSALDALRVGGRMLTIGENAEYTLRPSEHLLRNSLSIIGSWYSTMGQGAEVQRLLAAGGIDAAQFVTHRVDMEGGPRAFERVCNCTDDVLKTVIVIQQP